MARIMNYRNRLTVARFVGMLLAAVAATFGNNAAWAQNPPTGEFHLALAPSARLLDALFEPNFMDVQKEEACDNPHLRVRARNAPAVRIDNFSSTMSPITSLTFRINEGPYIFGTGDGGFPAFDGFIKPTMYNDPGVMITSSSVSMDKKSLTINFDGLVKDAKAIFCIDIDVDPNDPAGAGAFPFPDYRNVLFGAPLDNGSSPTDPASVTVQFQNGTTIGPANLQQLTEAPVYQNAVIRPYGLMDTVEVLTFEIPEPSSVALALGAIAAMGVISKRSKQR